MPSGNIFMFAGKSSAIIDASTFSTIKDLPIVRTNKPDETDETAPSRSYVKSASFALLPLDPAKNYAASVLVCGGSYGTKPTSPTVSSCAKITNPETDDDAHWVYEDEMPTGRVMPDIVLLPDETALIINGAEFGFSGYNDAINATQSPLIYDPKAKAGERIRYAGFSPIPRVCKWLF